MKKPTWILLVSLVNVVLPIDLPLYHLSSRAWAGDSSSVVPSSPTKKLTVPGVPVQTFEANVGITASAVNHMNMVLEVVASSTSTTTPASTTKTAAVTSSSFAYAVDAEGKPLGPTPPKLDPEIVVSPAPKPPAPIDYGEFGMPITQGPIPDPIGDQPEPM